MPLPKNGIAWPPAELNGISQKHAEFDAWYSGDLQKLANTYRVSDQAPVFDRVSQYRGGATGAVARMWWGKPTGNLFEKNTNADKLHIPLASDICQASADLLYAEAPTFGVATSSTTAEDGTVTTVEDKDTAFELDMALEQGLITVLAEGNEVGAALGDSYFRVTWDAKLLDRSFITTVHADHAWPEFRWGRLVAVTFWWKLQEKDAVVLRHLERHELDSQGNGVILHGLYEGTPDNLGRAVPLTEHSATQGLAQEVDELGMIDTLSPGLAVVHVPNQTPNRVWRHHPIGRNLGRSDLAGIESELDKLDMVWTSWMRDIRLAKARLIVPNFMLSSGGPGQGAIFDTDQDIFTSLNAPPREDGRADITPQQFEIRVQQHMQSADELVKVMLRTAGYGPQTFGDAGDVAQTATEVTSRDRRSNLTRDRKIRVTESPLKALIRKKLWVDKVLFSGKGNPEADLVVQFPDSTQANPADLAQTNALLFQAQSASVQTRVKIQHPDWDDTAVQEEANRILQEFGASVPDPLEVRPPGATDEEEQDPEQDPAEEEDQS
jgi:A118 family predicted phage portal protein